MHAYRFRIDSDENEEFLRVIDVLANQNFEDFHKLLVETCKFKNMELASFYLCDNEWHKKREITLMNMHLEENAEENNNEQSPKKKVLIMKDIKINQAINDPHQKILYVFDFMKMITLNIELMKISDADMSFTYPVIVQSKSELLLVPYKEMFSEEDVLDKESIDDLKNNGIELDTNNTNESL